MLTPPSDLRDARVAEVLSSTWSLAVDTVDYLPVGFGSHHWLAEARGRKWFVTVDVLTSRADVALDRLSRALSTARLLHEQGLGFVVAPIPTTGGDLLAPIDDGFAGMLYPFVAGHTHGWGPFADRASREAVLDRLVALHVAPREARRHARTDAFGIPCRDRLEVALTELPTQDGPFAEATRRLLAQRAGSVARQLVRYDGLVGRVCDRRERFVITHGEPHPGNTITTASGVVLVDWDTVLVAPPERDLWWLAREDEAIADEYERRAGLAVDRDALELYRLRWDLSDAALYTAQLLDPHPDNEDTRVARDALVACLDRLDGDRPRR